MNTLLDISARLEQDSIAYQPKPLEPDTEPALRALVRCGLNDVGQLELRGCQWLGSDVAPLNCVTVESDGTLRLETNLPNEEFKGTDPTSWKRGMFTAEALGHGRLTIEDGQGGARLTFERTVRLSGWRWSALSITDPPALWAAPVRFREDREPITLRWNHGNMLLVVDGSPVRGWRFESPRGPVYFLPRGDIWYLAVASKGERADFDAIRCVSAAIGFVLGFPFELGVFQRVDATGPGSGLIHLGSHPLPPSADARDERQPALPFQTHASWGAEFVNAIVGLSSSSDAPIIRCINLFSASHEGYLESQFLHAWLALESLSRWALASHRVMDGGNVRLADHENWIKWVRSTKAAIAALAAPGRAESLLRRVEAAEYNSPTKVQRVFRGLGIEWTAAMEDIERVRHGVAHEGAISGGAIESKRDRERIGLVGTMFTSLLAHLAGYSGPIADRSRTCFNITDVHEPEWRMIPRVLHRLEYHGEGSRELTSATVARLRELASSAP